MTFHNNIFNLNFQNPKKVGEDIAKSTGDWKGLRVTVRLTIANRQATIDVVPSAASMLIKSLNEPPRDRKKVKNGTLAKLNFFSTMFLS